MKQHGIYVFPLSHKLRLIILIMFPKIFDGLRKTNEKALRKVIPIGGDITVDALELSQQDEATLINNVNIIFHCAACINFDKSLKEVINCNVNGLLRILKLAETMKHLEVVSFMSSISSQSYSSELVERYYPTNMDVFKLIENVRSMSDKESERLAKEL